MENASKTQVHRIDLLACPACGASLRAAGPALTCAGGHVFESEQGIPLLFWPTDRRAGTSDVTDVIRTFYEAHPFPNYEDLDSIGTLRARARRSVFARWLDEQIPRTATLLEVGCGTGQLSNFLAATWGRTVFGADLSMASLSLAHGFKLRNRIESAAFLQMNLFKPAFRPGTFDIVICNGVLHHTSDPFHGFQCIARLVRPGGFIVIGLYNAYGRLATAARRVIFRVGGGRVKAAGLDPRRRQRDLGAMRRNTWLVDQYQNPHESTHTIGQILNWFDQTGFAFMTGIPKTAVFDALSENEQLFRAHPRGSRLEHVLVQAGMALAGGREGGLFIMIGRKPSAA